MTSVAGYTGIGYAEIDIFNTRGQRIAKMAREFYDLGEHIVKWNASHQCSGIFCYRIKSRNYIEIKKMLLIR